MIFMNICHEEKLFPLQSLNMSCWSVRPKPNMSPFPGSHIKVFFLPQCCFVFSIVLSKHDQFTRVSDPLVFDCFALSPTWNFFSNSFILDSFAAISEALHCWYSLYYIACSNQHCILLLNWEAAWLYKVKELVWVFTCCKSLQLDGEWRAQLSTRGTMCFLFSRRSSQSLNQEILQR